MALQLRKALQAYDRMDVADVDCGNGWTCQIKSFASVQTIFSKEQARIKAAGGYKKKSSATTHTVSLTNDGRPIKSDKDLYLFGTYEADIEFFLENILIGWTGLIDDNGKEVPFSKETASEVFLEGGEPAEQLYHELTVVALQQENFIKVLHEQAEEDGKN